jgi:hypothetical protein
MTVTAGCSMYIDAAEVVVGLDRVVANGGIKSHSQVRMNPAGKQEEQDWQKSTGCEYELHELAMTEEGRIGIS